MGSTGETRRLNSIVVIGTNPIATSITTTLSEANTLKINQIVHRRSSLTPANQVSVHESNFTPPSLHQLLLTLQPDIIISTSNGGDFAFQRLLIDTAISAGVQRFVPAEFGQDSLNERLQERLPPSRVRARVVEYLRECARLGSIEWVGVATGVALDEGIGGGKLGFDLKWHSATIGLGPELFAASSTAFIGRAVGAVLERWEEVRNQYLYCAGLRTTADEVLASLVRITGRKWEAGRTEVEDMVREGESRIARGFPDAGMFLMERSVLYDGALGAVRPFIEEDAKGLLGLDGEELEGAVGAAVHRYKHYGKEDCGCS
ncbi:hypothetical protein LTR62_000812 [Meristemomyces frigidus]|uniref:NmrA-like domain-containing protein n=1 Tax=Meristemomyces frigidus TaxID=1508187 RepID=A0AAN7TGG3_9PEZI|nr:hypothetical protein LTR62_000812 [Meristemomyces frigidus]